MFVAAPCVFAQTMQLTKVLTLAVDPKSYWIYTNTPIDNQRVEAVLKAEQLDFLQINYALDDRAVEKRILPLCRERGVAVICNRPFGGGGLIARLKGKPLPGWASQVQVNSWPQLALKFLLSHSAVTCVIPGTGNPRYMADNAAAGFGPMLTGAQREQLIDLVN